MKPLFIDTIEPACMSGYECGICEQPTATLYTYAGFKWEVGACGEAHARLLLEQLEQREQQREATQQQTAA